MNPNTMNPKNLPQPQTTFPAKRIYREPDKAGSKSKITRKPSSTKRVSKPKPQAILDIEDQARAAKERWREAQSSGAILERIQKLIARLTPEHRQALCDELSRTETPDVAPSDVQQGYIDVKGGAPDAVRSYGIVTP